MIEKLLDAAIRFRWGVVVITLASGLEPVSVISTYTYQDGLGYYESTKDASTSFYFSHIPRGTHVLEYTLRASHSGNFSNGITSIQCAYAPEFTSHSEGIRIEIK